MPMQPTCTKTNGAGSAGRVESEPPHVGWGKPWWERLVGAGLSTNGAAEATGGPAQRALLLTARATLHRLVDAADDLPNAAVKAYFGSRQRLPLEEVGEDNV